MATLLSQFRPNKGDGFKKAPLPLAQRPKMFRTKYSSLPVALPPDFLPALPPSSELHVEKIDFSNSALPEYSGYFAFIIDGVLDEAECKELIRYAEMSAGAHGHGDDGERAELVTFQALKSSAKGPRDYDGKDVSKEEEPDSRKENGWHQALVRAGANREMLSLQHRDSDRIIWGHQDAATRIWKRVLQAPGILDEIGVLEGERCRVVLGEGAVEREERWKLTQRGCNESLKFLRYGKGQYFREHCDGTYETSDGTERSFYTIHLYLNDSIAASDPHLEKELISLDLDDPEAELDSKTPNPEDEILEGGATTFHSRDMRFKIDVDPKVGRVLIFQQKGLLHSGDDVVRGVKYTMRSDIMYEFDDGEGGEEGEGDVVFG